MQRSSVLLVIATFAVGCSGIESSTSSTHRAVVGSADVVVHTAGAPLFQSETAIAANSDGSILVAAYNDGRGISVMPSSIAGVARSSDGGATWAEVGVGPDELGVLPAPVNTVLRGSPDVAYNADTDRFVYVSLFERVDGVVGVAVLQSSAGADAGAMWGGPIEVTPSYVTGEFASDPRLDIHPTTGRITVTWTQTNGAGQSRIMASFSDDLGVAWPAASSTLFTAAAGAVALGPVVRFGAGSDVYAVWGHETAGGQRNIGCARSTDSGASFAAAVDLVADFAAQDQIKGVERTRVAPGLGVNRGDGTVYVAFQTNDATGTGDIALRSFSGDCASAAATVLSSDPGNDGAQFNPTVAVDQSSGAAHVVFLDQDIADGDDLTEAMVTTSTDGGTTFSPPTPILDRPFRAGLGRISGQPNLGAYNGCTATGGNLHCVVGAPPVPTSLELVSTEAFYDRRSEADDLVPLRTACASIMSGGCDNLTGTDELKPASQASFFVSVENYVTNAAVGAETLTGISGTLTAQTAGVNVLTGSADFDDIAAGATGESSTAFTIEMSRAVSLGRAVEMTLALDTDQGSIEVPVELRTGSEGDITIMFQEDFDEGTDASLPAGWASTDGSTESATPDQWSVSDAFSGSRAAFHDNDGEIAEHQILTTPTMTVPESVNAAAILVEFDLTYKLQFDDAKAVEAIDGLTLGLVQKAATPEESDVRVLAEAVAREIVTGNDNHFPRTLPSTASFLAGAGVWSGDSGGTVPVSVLFSADGLSGADIALRFEYVEDGSLDCTASGLTAPCGVAVDNIQVTHVPLAAAADLAISTAPLRESIEPGKAVTFGVNVQNRGPDNARGLVVTAELPQNALFVTAIGDGYECTEAEGLITCTLAEMPVGVNKAVVLQYEAPEDDGELISQAEVTAASFDPDLSNNVIGLSALIEESGCSCQVGTRRPLPTTLGVILFAALACLRWQSRRRRRRK